jgi:hypothetical protein
MQNETAFYFHFRVHSKFCEAMDKYFKLTQISQIPQIFNVPQKERKWQKYESRSDWRKGLA